MAFITSTPTPALRRRVRSPDLATAHRPARPFPPRKPSTTRRARITNALPSDHRSTSSHSTSSDPAPPQSTPATNTSSSNQRTSAPFNWTDAWYPVAWADDVHDLKPVKFTIWQRHYVLFRDRPTGHYVVMDDVCPHRAAPLSEGRLYERTNSETNNTETVLECGYHGWRFDCTGRCVDIPVIPLEARIPHAADVGAVYATSVSIGGLIFVWLGDRLRADESKIPVSVKLREMDKQSRVLVFRNQSRTFPLNFATVLENVVDPAHVQWSHHGSGQGSRDLVTRDGGLSPLDSRPNEGYLVANMHRSLQSEPAMRVQFQAPGSLSYESLGATGFSLLTWCVPIDHDNSVLFSTNAIIDPDPKFKFIIERRPRWLEHTIANLVLDGDTVLMRGQQELLQRRKRDGYGSAWKDTYFPASGKWDILVVRLREWLEQQHDTMPYEYPLSPDASVPSIERRDLNDRYTHHTRHCTCCSAALRNFQRGRLVTFVFAAVFAAVTVFIATVYAALQVGGVPVARMGLWKFGCLSFSLCIALLVLARVLRNYERLFTYTDVAYRLSHV